MTGDLYSRFKRELVKLNNVFCSHLPEKGNTWKTVMLSELMYRLGEKGRLIVQALRDRNYVLIENIAYDVCLYALFIANNARRRRE